MAGKACPTCGQKQYRIVKVHEYSDLWGCLNCNWYGYHPKAFRGCEDRITAKQRKTLEEAAFWQARKDGIPYYKAKRLAKEATNGR